MKLKTLKINLIDATAIACVVILILCLFVRIVLLFSYAANNGGAEYNVIYNICKALYGGSLYDNPEANNYNITSYSPIYYLINIFLCRILNLSPLYDLHSIYVIGRSVSLIFNLMGGYLIYRLLHKIFSVDKRIALISAIVYFVSLSRGHFSTKPDSLFSLLFILIIYFFILYFSEQNKKTRNNYFIAALILAVISVFVKQTGIQYLILIPLFFLLTGQYRKFFASGLFLFFVSSLFAIICYWIYQDNFILNVVGGLNNGSSIPQIYYVFSNSFYSYHLFFVLGFVVSYYFFDTMGKLEFRFISFCVMFLFLFAFITSSKFGSWINYYNEFIVSVIIIATIKFERYRKEIPASDRIYKAVGSVICAYLIILLPNIIADRLFYDDLKNIKEPKENFIEINNVAQILHQKLDIDRSLYVLSFEEHINSMLADRVVVPNKDMVPSQSKFDYRNFHRGIQNGNIRYVVFHNDKPMYEFLGDDFSTFTPIYTGKSFTILENNFR